MDKKEFATLAMALKTYYPREDLLPNNQSMELWYEQLQDLPYKLAEIALRKWVALNKWSPTIADIRATCTEIGQGEVEDWGSGWKQVIEAIRRFGFYETDQALQSMDEITRKCVERLGFVNICHSEDINADRANFRMLYEQLSERKKQDAQIPSKVMELIKATAPKLIE